MVPTKEEEVLWVLNLVRQQETNSLQRLLATVHIVPEEQVVGFGGKSSVLKEPQKVIILSVDVT